MSTPEQPRPPFPVPIPSNVLAVILQYVKSLVREVGNLQTRVQLLAENENDVAVAVGNLVGSVAQDFSSLDTRLSNVEAGVAQIVAILNHPPPGPVVAFQIEVSSQGEIMAKAAAKIGKFKISLNPDGTATATLSGVVDAFGNPTTFQAPPTYVCETTPGAGQDPNVLLTPAADGMTCGIAANKVLVAGDTLTVTGDGVSETYSPVSVVAGPANSFVISVQ